jgi:hypothetical protein
MSANLLALPGEHGLPSATTTRECLTAALNLKRQHPPTSGRR